MASSTEFWFDEDAADRACAFFETYLTFTEGEWAGRPFALTPWQADKIVRPLFGWKRADGTRRYRRCFVWVPRKNGKTELAAGVALLALVGDAEPAAQVFSIAKDRDQARLVFGKATAMVQRNPQLGRLLECLRPSIYCPRTNGAFKPLSGTPEGKHGLSMSGLVGDEIHEWPNGDLYTFVHQSSASRRQPLEFLISTAGKRGSYGWEVWEYCQRLVEGVVEDDETLVVIFAADPADDWTDPVAWRKANPNLGVSLKEEYLAAECRRAQELPRLENDFKRYHLNLWTEQDVRWLPLHIWDANAGDIEWKAMAQALEGQDCFLGCDLASIGDLAAKVLIFPPAGERDAWALLPTFYVPEASVAQRVRRDKAPFDQWIRAGACKATPGNVIDYTAIRHDIEQDAYRYRLLGLGLDPWNAQQMMQELMAESLPVTEVRQGYVTLSGPSKELERLLLGGLIAHGAHPALRWCAGNVAVDTDPAGNIKPSKARSTERIDGISATVTGLALAIRGAEPPMVSPYEDPTFSIRAKVPA